MVLANASTVTSAARVDVMVSSDCSIVRRVLKVAFSMGWIVNLLKSSIITECVDWYWDEDVNCSSRERGSPLIKAPPDVARARSAGCPAMGRQRNPPTGAGFHPLSDNSSVCGNLTSPLETRAYVLASPFLPLRHWEPVRPARESLKQVRPTLGCREWALARPSKAHALLAQAGLPGLRSPAS